MYHHETTWKFLSVQLTKSWSKQNLKFLRTRSSSSCWASSLQSSPALTFSLTHNQTFSPKRQRSSKSKMVVDPQPSNNPKTKFSESTKTPDTQYMTQPYQASLGKTLKKIRDYLGIFPKRRTPPPPPFGNASFKMKFFG